MEQILKKQQEVKLKFVPYSIFINKDKYTVVGTQTGEIIFFDLEGNQVSNYKL